MWPARCDIDGVTPLLVAGASAGVDDLLEYESLESRDLAVTGRLLSWLILRNLGNTGEEHLEGGGEELCTPLALRNAGCKGYVAGVLSKS